MARAVQTLYSGALALILGGTACAIPATSAELLMLERPGCAWCARWDNEIAPAYPNTAESRIAPLRRVDITKSWPEDLRDIAADRFTPTFILTADGREVARLRGYPGDQFFWPLLDEMLAKLKDREVLASEKRVPMP